MRKSHRILITVLAVCLALALAVTALAEGVLGTLYAAATRLLFDTQNATLSAHAEFRFNGELFKTLDGTYVQDGIDSQMELKLKTPREDGSILNSGYTVIANDGLAYSIDPVNNPYVYNVSSSSLSTAILSTTALRRTILSLGGAVVGAAEGALADHIAVAPQGGGGAQYHIQLAEGDTPELINAAGTLVAQLAAKRFFYVDYDYMDDDPFEEDGDYCNVNYEDYDALFALVYEKLYGEKLPEDFYDQMWLEDGSLNQTVYARYETVIDQVTADYYDPIDERYQSGAVMIHPDGSHTYYDTLDAFMVDNGLQEVNYAQYDQTFRRYYEKVTGTPLSAAEMTAIWLSGNEELWDAYMEMASQMEEEYLQMVRADGKASAIQVKADGSTRMVYDYVAFKQGEMVPYYSYTLTDSILQTMRGLELGNTDATVTLDGEGRVTAAAGTVCLLVLDPWGNKNELEIAFDVSAGQYGASTVETFDPAKFGVMTWEEYARQVEKNGLPAVFEPTVEEPEEIEIPETIVFNGAEYPVMAYTEGDV